MTRNASYDMSPGGRDVKTKGSKINGHEFEPDFYNLLFMVFVVKFSEFNT